MRAESAGSFHAILVEPSMTATWVSLVSRLAEMAIFGCFQWCVLQSSLSLSDIYPSLILCYVFCARPLAYFFSLDARGAATQPSHATAASGSASSASDLARLPSLLGGLLHLLDSTQWAWLQSATEPVRLRVRYKMYLRLRRAFGDGSF